MDISNNVATHTPNYADYSDSAGVSRTAQSHSEAAGAEGKAETPEAAVRAEMAKAALTAAGLKPDINNLKLVSLLLEHEMPINKEALTALERITRLTGTENAEKALLLMKNNIPLTLGALETLSSYTEGGAKIAAQVEALAKSIMDMADGPVKRQILQALFETPAPAASVQTQASQHTGQTPQNAQNPAGTQAAQNPLETQTAQPQTAQTSQQAAQAQASQTQTPQASQQAAQAAQTQTPQASQQAAQTQTPQASQQAAQTAQTQAAQTQAAQTQTPQASQQAAQTHAASEPQTQAAEQNAFSLPNEKLETGTAFFRETFTAENAGAHLKANPPSTETQKFIENNLETLKNGFSELSSSGNVTKEDIESLVKSTGADKLPLNLKSEAEIKTFVLALADKSGLLKENADKAELLGDNASKAAKMIAARLSLRLDDREEAEKLEKATENLKEKLSLIAGKLGDGAGSDKVRRGIEDIKDNMKYLNNFKSTELLEIPLVLDGQQKHAELYVFSRKGGGANKGGAQSQSALLSLDLANLGHFETYVQKTGRSVVCQFRIENDETEALVRENIERLSTALKDKSYTLDAIMYKKTDERFTLADDEPQLDEDGKDTKAKGGMLSLDLRT